MSTKPEAIYWFRRSGTRAVVGVKADLTPEQREALAGALRAEFTRDGREWGEIHDIASGEKGLYVEIRKPKGANRGVPGLYDDIEDCMRGVRDVAVKTLRALGFRPVK